MVNKFNKSLSLLFATLLCVGCGISTTGESTSAIKQQQKIKALIVDGQNNHGVWPKSTAMMAQYLTRSGLFDVDVYRTKPTWKGKQSSKYYQLYSDNSHFAVKSPTLDPNFAPDFSQYQVVISNFGHKTASWPKQTELAFENYMVNGGGLVVIHAANNAFPHWLAFNEMLGLGGWGGRNEKSGPHLYYDDTGRLHKNNKKGRAGTHGKQHELTIIRRTEHPIMSGLPKTWLHTKDECYGKLRGPANNMTILATAYCDKQYNGTGNHEPALMVINYGQGRVFHSILGHDDYSFEGVGFITTFLRGAEWAATGTVSQKVPSDFPSSTLAKKRQFQLVTD